MATRFYTPRWDGRAAPVSTAPGAQWEQTANSFSGASARLAATTKDTTTPLSTTSSDFVKTGTTQPWDVLQMQCVSDTLDVAQAISGTLSGVFRIGETAAAADLSLQVVVRVVSQDGSTERGVLYAGHAAALNTTTGALGQEAGTTAATRLIPSGTAVSTVNALAGDRIVIEVGARHHAAASGGAAYILFGDDSGTADYALTANLTTSLVPWVELSQDLTFGTPAISGAAALAVTATLAAASSADRPVGGGLAVTATLTAASASTRPAGGALAVTATLTAAGGRAAAAGAALAVTASVTASGNRTAPDGAALAVTAALTAAAAVGSAPIAASAGLAITATLSASAARTAPAAAALAVTASLAATGSRTAAAAAALSATATLTAGGFQLQQLGAALAVLATLLADVGTQGRITSRPNTGTTTRPDSGVTARPFAGVTARP